MDCENGRRLTTKANVADNRGEKLTTPSSTVNSDTASSSHQEKNGSGSAKDSLRNVPNLRVEAPGRSEKSATNSPESNKRRSDVAHDSSVVTESPAIQVMERPKPSDSERTESLQRWSVDSNDSLFSITMGNDSFSKDKSLRISSADMLGIGELSLSEAYLPRVAQRSSNNSPAAKSIDDDHKEVKKDANKPAVNGPNRHPPEASISVHTDSNLSGSSDHRASSDYNKSRNESFASPSTSVTSCPTCRSLCCFKMDWHLRWPSWCCRWPGCSCCNWCTWPTKCCNFCSRCPNFCSCFSKCYGSCCCYNRNHETKRVRSVSSYALMDRNVGSSSKHNV